MPSVKLSSEASPIALTRSNWVPPKPSYCSPKPSTGATLIIKSPRDDAAFDDRDDEDSEDGYESEDMDVLPFPSATMMREPYVYNSPAQGRRTSSDKGLSPQARSMSKASKILGTNVEANFAKPPLDSLRLRAKEESWTAQRSAVLDAPIETGYNR